MASLAVLSRVAGALELTLEAAIAEKTRELEARQYLLCIPDDLLAAADVPSYLKRVLRADPPLELVERVLRKPRAVKLSEEEQLELEARQNLRCALCGALLTRLAEPHIDHVTPVALGGASDLRNLQASVSRL